MIRVSTALLLFVALLLASPAFADSSRVLLVRPQRTDPTIITAFNRLRGELMASGFTVIVHDAAAGTTPKELAAAARTHGAFASVSIVRSNGNTTADVWISDRVTGKTSVRTISTTRRDAPELLAVRATDLLRVSLREFGDEAPPADIASADSDQTVAYEARGWASDPAPAWRLHAGVGALAALSDVPAALGPVVGLGYGFGFGQRIEFGMGLVGPLLTRDWTAPDGRVALRQEIAMAHFSVTPELTRVLSLELVAAAGAYHLAVSGEADPPLVSRSDEVWALALMPGLGLNIQLTPSAAFRFGAAAVIRFPEPEVLMGDRQESLGQPGIMATAGLKVGL